MGVRTASQTKASDMVSSPACCLYRSWIGAVWSVLAGGAAGEGDGLLGRALPLRTNRPSGGDAPTGAASAAESAEAGDGAAEDEGVDVVGALVGVHRLQV